MKNHASSIKTLSLSFDLPVFARQLSNWRGAFIEMAGWQDDLFHNHKTATQYVYRYPLIQYRIMRGKAGVFAINEGVDALQKILAETDWKINWQGEVQHLNIAHLQMNEHYLHMLTNPKLYRLYKWLPLYGEKYEQWKMCSGLTERILLLESVLTKQLQRFCESMGYSSETNLEVKLQHIQLMEKVNAYNTQMIAFNIDYTANVLLPDNIALGRGIAKGFGWQKGVRKFVEKGKKNKIEELIIKINTE